MLVCGCCGSRWQFRRTQCPFCENDAQRLATLAVEGESGLRLDHCESLPWISRGLRRRGPREGPARGLRSLHLDLLARDRGLEHRASSLYQLETPRPDASADEFGGGGALGFR